MKNIPTSPARRALASNVKRLRLAKGWSQVQLARKAGVAQTAISYIEKPDGKSPSMETLESVAAAFGIPYWALSIPNLDISPAELIDAGFVLETFIHAPHDGKQQIRRIAEAEARYTVIPRLPAPGNHLTT